ncbi:MAG: hypothetical protein ACYC91_13925 [Solirubrobacteraceae bacterium]
MVVHGGYETGRELLDQALRVLETARLELELVRFDHSLESRRSTSNRVVSQAAAAMRACRLGIKAATITPEGDDDLGSPNRILREEVDGKVIVRTGRRLPGDTPIAACTIRSPRANGGRRRLWRREAARGSSGRSH